MSTNNERVWVKVVEPGPFYGASGMALRQPDGAWFVSLVGWNKGKTIVTRKVSAPRHYVIRRNGQDIACFETFADMRGGALDIAETDPRAMYDLKFANDDAEDYCSDCGYSDGLEHEERNCLEWDGFEIPARRSCA